MKETILTAAMLIAAVGALHAQQQATYIKAQNKQDIVFGLLSGQIHDGVSKPSAPKTSKIKRKEAPKPKETTVTLAMQSALINSPTDYISGEDKYIKKKEDNKRYKEFQVYDINGMDKDHVVLGLLTNTLDRGVRYDENGEPDKKIYVSTGYIDQVDEKGKVIPGAKVQVSTLRLNDKVFVIIGENDYRYQDGKRLVGGQKLVDEMIKGKPVTEITFYYELQKAGILNKGMSLKDFTKMNLNQKQQLLNTGSIAGEF